MRLVLPTGQEGVPRSYPLDNILDLSQLTLNDAIDLKRATGLGISDIARGFGLLDRLMDVPTRAVLEAMSEHLELMEAWRALVWVARHRAGDRSPDGGALTVEQAVDFPFDGLNVETDPGDMATEVEEPDPPAPPAPGSPAPGGASPDRAIPSPSPEISAEK